MLANFLKTLTSKRYSYELTRQLCSTSSAHKENTAIKQKDDEEDIGANLFEHSSIKYEPVAKDNLIKNAAQKSKSRKNTPAGPSTAKRPSFPSLPSTSTKKTSRFTGEPESKVIKDTELGLEYIKLNLKDPQLSTLLITARSKKRRDKNHEIIVEGRRLILEALECGLKLKSIIFSKKDQLADIKDEIVEALKLYPSKIYKVPHHDLKTWSTLTTPPGIMTVFERPSLKYIANKLANSSPPLPVTVICDNIREPNNLGSIIRSCAALPCFQILITKGCCDPWESKSLRGGCGGHFRVPIQDDIDWEEVPLLISPEFANDCCVFIAENNWGKEQNNTVEYSAIENVGSHNVVIIGGESHGVSTEAYGFMSTVGSRGKCLYIPLAKGVDSLNVASALTLILYELRKSIVNPKKDITTVE